MSPIRLPSDDVPESQKRGFSEADVHSTLFEPDMRALGYPLRTSSQADGEYFVEQRSLAVRRLRSGCSTGFYDGLYLVGNSPVVLCELKRYDALDRQADWDRAKDQLIGYARSEDFAVPPPFLVFYCGKPERNRFFRRKTVADPSLLGELDYEELDEIWSWQRIKEFQLRGEFALEEVARERLLEILLYHLDRIEDDMRPLVAHGVQVVSDNPPQILTEFGRWLQENPAAGERLRRLHELKVAEVGRPAQAVEEMVTQAALNYLNKVFFLNLCEDRNLPGFPTGALRPRSKLPSSSGSSGSLPRSRQTPTPTSSRFATRSTIPSSICSRYARRATRFATSTAASDASRLSLRLRASRPRRARPGGAARAASARRRRTPGQVEARTGSAARPRPSERR